MTEFPPNTLSAIELVQDVDLKATREALCASQSALGERGRAGIDTDKVSHWVARLQVLCDAIDVHRPLGSDGKHGDRHTPSCGCDDTSVSATLAGPAEQSQ